MLRNVRDADARERRGVMLEPAGRRAVYGGEQCLQGKVWEVGKAGRRNVAIWKSISAGRLGIVDLLSIAVVADETPC